MPTTTEQPPSEERASRPRGNLEGTSILLGITGGIACYKAAELARLLVKDGSNVSVIMTEAAQRFIAPLTFEALTGNPVGTSLWETMTSPTDPRREIHHTEVSRHADAIVVAPATADFLARCAAGMANDLLTSTLLATKRPTLLCPSMNAEMWSHPATQRNLEFLESLPHVRLLEPDAGELACGVVGPGRLPEPPAIKRALLRLVTPSDLAGIRILITAGPTREFADPVRFLSNPSTGKMGYALAEAAWQRGAEVTVIHGPTAELPPAEVRSIAVESAAGMATATRSAISNADVLIMAAAVADWTPATVSTSKVKKTGGTSHLDLVRTEDILLATRELGPLVRIGFAAETDEPLAHAAQKLMAKKLDAIVVNLVGRTARRTGFAAPTNAGWILTDQTAEELPLQSKEAFAHRVLDAARAALEHRRSRLVDAVGEGGA